MTNTLNLYVQYMYAIIEYHSISHY